MTKGIMYFLAIVVIVMFMWTQSHAMSVFTDMVVVKSTSTMVMVEDEDGNGYWFHYKKGVPAFLSAGAKVKVELDIEWNDRIRDHFKLNDMYILKAEGESDE